MFISLICLTVLVSSLLVINLINYQVLALQLGLTQRSDPHGRYQQFSCVRTQTHSVGSVRTLNYMWLICNVFEHLLLYVFEHVTMYAVYVTCSTTLVYMLYMWRVWFPLSLCYIGKYRLKSLAIPSDGRGRSGSGETQARPEATGMMTEIYALVLYLNEKSFKSQRVQESLSRGVYVWNLNSNC